jgi:predicted small lipoprotein YifL
MNLGSSRVIVLLLLLAGITAGCGLKGDLYLPESEAPTTAATEEDDEDKDGSSQAGATDSATPSTSP